MKPKMNIKENITEALIAQLQAEELQKIANETSGIHPETSPVYRMAKRAALRVDFIETVQELRLYTDALCRAISWGQAIG